MPTYRLTYFDGRGRGELCRYVFHAAEIDFEDERLTFEKWISLKPSSPFGQLPFLEVDGKILAQSAAIARFLAREFGKKTTLISVDTGIGEAVGLACQGIAGKDSWEQALTDQYVELADDLFREVVKWFFEKDEEKKEELKKNLDDVLYPKFCGIFEKSLEQNGGQFFVGNSLTLADLAVLNVFDTPMLNTPKCMDRFPKLKAHRERISSLPKIASHIKNRKEMPI